MAYNSTESINIGQTVGNLLDTDEKRRIRQIISDSLTSDVRDECPGLVVLVLSFDEYDIMRQALKERADRKRRHKVTGIEMSRTDAKLQSGFKGK